jgi:hypothetical protein
MPELTNNTPSGQSMLASNAPVKRVPHYLITLEKEEKTQKRFIAIDKPRSLDGFVEVKGFFCEKKEDEIIKSYLEIVASSPKEQMVEMMFPLHKICQIRSLVFNAVKNITPITHTGQ